MKAIRFLEPGKIEIQEIPKPIPESNELQIQVKASGVCGTDVHIYHGTNKGLVKPGTVLGHEFAGVVSAIGTSVTEYKIGDHVAVQPNLFCGHCYYCRTARKHFCQNWSAIGLTYDGGFQEYCVVPAIAVYKIPETVSFQTAAFFEPLSCVIHGIERCNIKLGETVLVQGAGGIGQLFIKVLCQMGLRRIIVSDIDDSKLELALKNGASNTVNVKEYDLHQAVNQLTDGFGVGVFIDAAGLTTTIVNAVPLVENSGRILIFGVPNENGTAEIIPYQIYKKEIQVIGSYTNPYSNIAAVSMLEKIDTDDLVTNPISLDQLVADGLEKIGQLGVLKVQVVF